MRNKCKSFWTQRRILCVTALLAAIAFSMAACDSGFGDDGGTDPRLNGTWILEDSYHEIKVTFYNGSWESAFDGETELKGTYITNGNSLTATRTHIYGWVLCYDSDIGDIVRNQIWNAQNKWYSRAELKALGVPENWLNQNFGSQTVTYSVNGNTLYITYSGEIEVYHKR